MVDSRTLTWIPFVQLSIPQVWNFKFDHQKAVNLHETDFAILFFVKKNVFRHSVSQRRCTESPRRFMQEMKNCRSSTDMTGIGSICCHFCPSFLLFSFLSVLSSSTLAPPTWLLSAQSAMYHFCPSFCRSHSASVATTNTSIKSPFTTTAFTAGISLWGAILFPSSLSLLLLLPQLYTFDCCFCLFVVVPNVVALIAGTYHFPLLPVLLLIFWLCLEIIMNCTVVFWLCMFLIALWQRVWRWLRLREGYQ